MKLLVTSHTLAMSVGFMVGMLTGIYLEIEHFKDISIRPGHAEYVLKGSEAVWQWKDLKHKETP